MCFHVRCQFNPFLFLSLLLNSGKGIHRPDKQARVVQAPLPVFFLCCALAFIVRGSMRWQPKFKRRARSQNNTAGQRINLMDTLTLFNQQIAEVKVSYSHKVKPSNQVKITCSRDVYNYMLPLWPDIDYRESFAIMLLSRSNKVLGISWISLGGVSGTVADSKIIFQTALKTNACGIVLMHNHPSCALTASDADLKLTQKIKSGGQFLDIAVLDHVIITSDGYLSLADEGQF
jgi:DNA repair protein RadC